MSYKYIRVTLFVSIPTRFSRVLKRDVAVLSVSANKTKSSIAAHNNQYIYCLISRS